MHPNVHSKPFDTGADRDPIYSPTSSYPPRSMCGRHTLSRHVKVASESLAYDFFQRSQRFPSPEPSDVKKCEVSSPDEDFDPSHSTRSMEHLVLAAKDRLKSASLEWTLSNGSVTPRAPHYHTHPPLDFKGLKKKLEQLTGSPDDANKKPFPGISSLDRRKGCMTALPATTADKNPAGGYSCIDAVKQTDQEVETRTAGANFFQNVPYVTTERLSRTPAEEVDAKPMKITLSTTSINQSANECDSESSVKFQWSDLAQRVAEKDERLQELMKRHCAELEDLEKKHELQWVELRKRTSESVSEDLPHNYVPVQSEQPNRSFQEVALGTHNASTVPETRFEVYADGPVDRRELALNAEPIGKRYTNQERIDHRPLLAPGVDLMPCSPGATNVKQIAGHSLGNSVVAEQSDVYRVEDIDRESMRKDFHLRADGVRNLNGVHGGGKRLETGIPQHLPAQVRGQLAIPLMTMVQRQMENQASHPMDPYIWRHLVERTQVQMKDPPMQQQVQSHNWHQMLEMFQRMQAAASLEHWIRQPDLHQMSLLQAIAEAQAQSAKFLSHCIPNHQCHCTRPCDLCVSFLPHFHEHCHSADHYSVLNLTAQAGIGYMPNCAQVLPFPQTAFMQQSPCNEILSYYYPENLTYPSRTTCLSPDQMACLLEAARNNMLYASPALSMLPPMPLLSHLVACQSPRSPDQAHVSSIRSSPALSLLSSRPVFQFSPTQTTPSDTGKLFFPPNPIAKYS